MSRNLIWRTACIVTILIILVEAAGACWMLLGGRYEVLSPLVNTAKEIPAAVRISSVVTLAACAAILISLWRARTHPLSMGVLVGAFAVLAFLPLMDLFRLVDEFGWKQVAPTHLEGPFLLLWAALILFVRRWCDSTN
jgi:hypothetical protein